MNNRAYSILEVKSISDDQRVIRGIATTPSVDRVGDIIDPMGIKFNNPLPFLWQHQHDKPVGHVKFFPATEAGIEFEATVASVDEPGTLKDRLDEAWQSLKSGLVRAVSIGFRPIEYNFMNTGGIHFSETEVYELSAVTIPANADAVITAIKSIDRQFRVDAGVPEPEVPVDSPDAASGSSRVVKLDTPARDGAKPFVIRSIKRQK